MKRSSHQMKTARSTAKAVMPTTTMGESQPVRGPLVMADKKATNTPVDSVAPCQSNLSHAPPC